MKKLRWFYFALIATGICIAGDEPSRKPSMARWRQHDIQRPKPPVVEPAKSPVASKPPRDAVVLFDGSNLDSWKSPYGGPPKWRFTHDFMETAPGSGPIETRQKFGDLQIHIEWAAPNPPHGKGQDRGNSGLFLMGQFEIQVLDSYKADTYADGQAGAIYGQYPPLFNASRPPGEWQSYDIAFRRPRFDAANLVEPARVTVFHNGILVQNNEEPFGPTSWLKWLPYENRGDKGVISLQDHDHPVRYRNIWVREIPDRLSPTEKAMDRPKIVTLSSQELDQYVGQYSLNPKPDSNKAVITREGNHLVLKLTFRPQTLALEPISATEFDMPFTDGRFTFRKDNQGHVTSVLFRIGDSEREMKKINSKD